MSTDENTKYYIVHKFIGLNGHEMLDFLVENQAIISGPMSLKKAETKLKTLPRRKHGWYQIIKETNHDPKRNTSISGKVRRISRRECCKNARID